MTASRSAVARQAATLCWALDIALSPATEYGTQCSAPLAQSTPIVAAIADAPSDAPRSVTPMRHDAASSATSCHGASSIVRKTNAIAPSVAISMIHSNAATGSPTTREMPPNTGESTDSTMGRMMNSATAKAIRRHGARKRPGAAYRKRGPSARDRHRSGSTTDTRSGSGTLIATFA